MDQVTETPVETEVVDPEAGIPEGAPSEGTPTEEHSGTPDFGQLDDQGKADQYAHALRGLTEKAQENAQLKQQMDDLRGKMEQMQQAVQDPATLKYLMDRAQPNGEAAPTQLPPDQLAQELGMEDASLIEFMDRYTQARGLMRRDDPTLQQGLQQLNSLQQTSVQSQWAQVAGQYEGADKFQNQVLDLIHKTGGALSMDQALHAVSGGQLRSKSAILEAKKAAQLARPAPARNEEARDVNPVTANNGTPGVNGHLHEDPRRAFRAAAKEQGIDLNKLFGTKW